MFNVWNFDSGVKVLVEQKMIYDRNIQRAQSTGKMDEKY
jgi:hypothetical protein